MLVDKIKEDLQSKSEVSMTYLSHVIGNYSFKKKLVLALKQNVLVILTRYFMGIYKGYRWISVPNMKFL